MPVQEDCLYRLEAILGAFFTLSDASGFAFVKGILVPSATLLHPLLRVHRINQKYAEDPDRQLCWEPVPERVLRDIEPLFFQGAYSRPKLRKRGLFAHAGEMIETAELTLDRVSAHQRLAAHASLNKLGLSLP